MDNRTVIQQGLDYIEVSKALDGIGLLGAVPVSTADGAEYIQEGELYFYLICRLPGAQMESRRFGEGDGRPIRNLRPGQ